MGVAAYALALKQHIQERGPCSFVDLGAAVKRPAVVPKLKRFLEQHTDFSIDAQGMVSLSDGHIHEAGADSPYDCVLCVFLNNFEGPPRRLFTFCMLSDTCAQTTWGF
jgi:hypothetical protein